jgi:hypothetical protein
MAEPESWRSLLTSVRWVREPERTKAGALRCGVCRMLFIPEEQGAPTFSEEGGGLLIRACPACEDLLHVVDS